MRKQKNGSVGMVRGIWALVGVNLALSGTPSSISTGDSSELVVNSYGKYSVCKRILKLEMPNGSAIIACAR